MPDILIYRDPGGEQASYSGLVVSIMELSTMREICLID